MIGVSHPRRKMMEAQGVHVPPSLKLPFLIDTGADTTMVSEQTMRTLGIPERGARDIVGSTTHIDPTTCSAHDIEFQIQTPGDPALVIPALEVLARPFFNVSIDGLIGRDVLDRCILTIGRGQFHLEY